MLVHHRNVIFLHIRKKLGKLCQLVQITCRIGIIISGHQFLNLRMSLKTETKYRSFRKKSRKITTRLSAKTRN